MSATRTLPARTHIGMMQSQTGSGTDAEMGSAGPVENSTFTFGKHRGLTFEDVFQRHQGYVTWAKGLSDCNAGLKQFLRYVGWRESSSAVGMQQPSGGGAMLSTRGPAVVPNTSFVAGTSSSVERPVKIQKLYLNHIKHGRKTVEGRLASGHMKQVRVGDTLRFESGNDVVRARVVAMKRYSDFEAMLESEGLANCLPGCASLKDGVAVYHSFPNYEVLSRRDGVLAFRITLNLDSSKEDEGAVLVGPKSMAVSMSSSNSFAAYASIPSSPQTQPQTQPPTLIQPQTQNLIEIQSQLQAKPQLHRETHFQLQAHPLTQTQSQKHVQSHTQPQFQTKLAPDPGITQPQLQTQPAPDPGSTSFRFGSATVASVGKRSHDQPILSLHQEGGDSKRQKQVVAKVIDLD